MNKKVETQIENELIEQVKEQCAAQIAEKRNEFCQQLLVRGFGPDMCELQESFSIEANSGELNYDLRALNRVTGEPIQEEDEHLLSEDIWTNPDFIVWFESVSAPVQDMARRLPPNGTYYMKENVGPNLLTYKIVSYDEDDQERVWLRILNQKSNMIMEKIEPFRLTLIEKKLN